MAPGLWLVADGSKAAAVALGLGLWAERRGLEPIAQMLLFASNSQRMAAISKEFAAPVRVWARYSSSPSRRATRMGLLTLLEGLLQGF